MSKQATRTRAQRAWMPLQAAIALVLTRDPSFADEVEHAPQSGRNIHLDLLGRVMRWKDEDRPVSQHYKNADEALRVLLGFIADEAVGARGVAVDRHRIKGANYTEIERLGSILDPISAEQLVMRERSNGETWLAPKNTVLLGGQGRYWKNVTVNRSHLHKALGMVVEPSDRHDASLLGHSNLNRSRMSGRGRKPDLLPEHWKLLKAEALRLLDEYGDPEANNAHAEFNSKEKMMAKLTEFAQAKPKRFPKVPGRTSLQKPTNEWLEEFRSAQIAKN